MPIALFGTSALLLGLFLVFNTSQLSSNKQRLNNAADAAAYSTAVFQARTLNSIAYANRAMVANQVFIGQMVSLENYLNYWQVTSRNLSYIPYINIIAAPVNQAVQSIQTATEGATALAIGEAKITNEIISLAQIASAEFAGKAGLLETAYEVAKANDDRIEFTAEGVIALGIAAEEWIKVVQKQESNEDLVRKAMMINRSRDSFTETRGYSQRLLPILSAVLKLDLVKGGETALTWKENGNNVDFSWQSTDALTFKIYNRFKLRNKTKKIPVGWSKRYLSQDGNKETCDEDYSGLFGSFFNSRPHSAEEMAAIEEELEFDEENEERPELKEGEAGPLELPSYWDYTGEACNKMLNDIHYTAESLAIYEQYDSVGANSGNKQTLGEIQPFYELTDRSNKDPRFPIVISIYYSDEDVGTSSTIDKLGSEHPQTDGKEISLGMFHQKEEMPMNQLSAIAKAEVFFRRPEQRVSGKYGATDNDDEFANVWNPYWGARLVNPAAERTADRTLRLGAEL
ncbi:MAG: pilus assembly protein TadG-related protein [Granulosicoccaceae bacterium]